MKLHAVLIALLLLPLGLAGQRLYPLQIVDDSLTFSIGVAAGHLALQWSGSPTLFQSRNNFPDIVAVRLEDADLVVVYRQKNDRSEQSYQIALSLQNASGKRHVPSEHTLRASEPVENHPDQRRLIWMDAAEQMLGIGNTYILHVRRSLMGAVNCGNVRPAFTLNQQLPHYAAAGIGLALVGLGQVYRDRSDEAYTQYRQFWADGKPLQDAEDFLAEAKDRDKTAKICTYSGLAILGLDALWYTIRRVRVRNRQTIYDQFCGHQTSGLRVDPVWFAAGGAGLCFSISF